MKGNCFTCIHLTQDIKDKSPFHCGHIMANKEVTDSNIGRGFYCYPNIYDQCDIDKYNKSKK